MFENQPDNKKTLENFLKKVLEKILAPILQNVFNFLDKIIGDPNFNNTPVEPQILQIKLKTEDSDLIYRVSRAIYGLFLFYIDGYEIDLFRDLNLDNKTWLKTYNLPEVVEEFFVVFFDVYEQTRKNLEFVSEYFIMRDKDEKGFSKLVLDFFKEVLKDTEIVKYLDLESLKPGDVEIKPGTCYLHFLVKKGLKRPYYVIINNNNPGNSNEPKSSLHILVDSAADNDQNNQNLQNLTAIEQEEILHDIIKKSCLLDIYFSLIKKTYKKVAEQNPMNKVLRIFEIDPNYGTLNFLVKYKSENSNSLNQFKMNKEFLKHLTKLISYIIKTHLIFCTQTTQNVRGSIEIVRENYSSVKLKEELLKNLSQIANTSLEKEEIEKILDSIPEELYKEIYKLVLEIYTSLLEQLLSDLGYAGAVDLSLGYLIINPDSRMFFKIWPKLQQRLDLNI